MKNLWDKFKALNTKVFLSHLDKKKGGGNWVIGKALKGMNSDVRGSKLNRGKGGRKWGARLFDGGWSYLNEIYSI